MKRQAIITILLAFVAVLGQAQTAAPQEKKAKTSFFALFSIRFALPFALLNVGGTSGKKAKNFVICFVFHSVCTTFAKEFEVRVSR